VAIMRKLLFLDAIEQPLAGQNEVRARKPQSNRLSLYQLASGIVQLEIAL
jgi:hypothetical protein